MLTSRDDGFFVFVHGHSENGVEISRTIAEYDDGLAILLVFARLSYNGSEEKEYERVAGRI